MDKKPGEGTDDDVEVHQSACPQVSVLKQTVSLDRCLTSDVMSLAAAYMSQSH